MVKFFCDYIQNDNIGTFAHAHLVWADKLEDGIFSQKCMAIAKRYPYVLDFAKHGTTEYLKKSERPYNYPDFLHKGLRGNTYHSRNVLGTLYRTSRVLDACSSKINLIWESTFYDHELEYPGWESYRNSAEEHKKEYVLKVLEILNRYGFVTEAEALSGFIEVDAYKKCRQDKTNAVKVVKRYLNSIMEHYRNLFFAEFQKECEEQRLSKEESVDRKFQRASAWYMAVYCQKPSRVLSFPWVLGDILSEIKRNKSQDLANSDTSNFYNEIDSDIQKWYATRAETYDVNCCFCNHLLKIITQIWLSKSGLNFGNSDESVYCHNCYNRVFNFYEAESKFSSCSQSCDKFCSWNQECSPAKVIVDFLKFYITNINTSLGKCDKNECQGFLPKNLQELALQTFTFIAITRNIFYFGLEFNSDSFMTNAIASDVSGNLYEEEDPIKIPANPILRSLVDSYSGDIKTYLKIMSGVRDITLTPDPDTNCLIVNSIGKNWQRWNLQEILLDANFTENLRQNLNV